MIITCYRLTIIACYGLTIIAYYGLTIIICYVKTIIACYGLTIITCHGHTPITCYGPTTITCCTYVTDGCGWCFWQRNREAGASSHVLILPAPVSSHSSPHCKQVTWTLAIWTCCKLVKLFHISDISYIHGFIKHCGSERGFHKCSFKSMFLTLGVLLARVYCIIFSSKYGQRFEWMLLQRGLLVYTSTHNVSSGSAVGQADTVVCNNSYIACPGPSYGWPRRKSVVKSFCPRLTRWDNSYLR